MNEKPTWKSTEFWMAILTPVLIALAQAIIEKFGGNADQQTIGAAGTGATSFAYIAGRSAVKAFSRSA